MNERKKMRHAFSMLTAIIVIVLMASVGAFVLSLSGKTVKITTAQYQHAQAELYAKSYTEYAILAVTGNDRSMGCIKEINGTVGTPATGNGYKIGARVQYIGVSDAVTGCSGAVIEKYEKTPLTIIIDVFVDYKDPDNTGGPYITFHKRSVAKI